MTCLLFTVYIECHDVCSIHCKEKMPKIWSKYSQKRNIRASVPISTFMCLSVSELYIPTMELPFLLEEICGPILGIYKSLTDTWMWKLGLRPRYSQKGIYKRNCRCSVHYIDCHDMCALYMQCTVHSKSWHVCSMQNIECHDICVLYTVRWLAWCVIYKVHRMSWHVWGYSTLKCCSNSQNDSFSYKKEKKRYCAVVQDGHHRFGVGGGGDRKVLFSIRSSANLEAKD